MMHRPESDVDGCVFCTRLDQPAALFETPSLYVMPDKFPMQPGHVLIVSKEHRRCYAMAPVRVLRELDEAAARVRAFLEETYNRPVLIFENGIAGQSVFHAHLHLMPGLVREIPTELTGHDDVIPIEGWQAVRAHFARHGPYRYAQMNGERYVIAGYSPVMRILRRLIVEATGLRWNEQGWIKTTSPADVRAVNRQWRERAVVSRSRKRW